MKCFRIILSASGFGINTEDSGLYHELGVIFAESREEAEETLGVTDKGPAPPFLAAKIPPPITHREGSRVYELQNYGEGTVRLIEVPVIQTRKGLENVVASTEWTKRYCYELR